MPSPALNAARIGEVAELWRYPVKSMGGERRFELRLTSFGIDGDRQLAFESADAPVGRPLLRAAQRAAMLRASASVSDAGSIFIRVPTPDAAVDAEAPATLLVDAGDQNCSVLLSERLGIAGARLSLLRSQRPMTDVRPLAMHSTATSLAIAAELNRERLPGFPVTFDQRRLRSNLIFDVDRSRLAKALRINSDSLPTFLEDSLTGRTLQIGESARLAVLERIPRCGIVSLDPASRSGESPVRDPGLLLYLARAHQGRAGVYARPIVPGLLREGDPLLLLA